MASIYVSDVMDQVALTAEIQGWSEQGGPPDIQWQATYVWPGIGEDDALRWAERALKLMCQEIENGRSKGPRAAIPMGGVYSISETTHSGENMMG